MNAIIHIIRHRATQATLNEMLQSPGSYNVFWHPGAGGYRDGSPTRYGGVR